jgi:hypothetical protein
VIDGVDHPLDLASVAQGLACSALRLVRVPSAGTHGPVLFALYAFVHEPGLVACASLSGSLWYEGWVTYLGGLDPDVSGRLAFLSVGRKEVHAGLPPLRTVRENTEATANILRSWSCEVRMEVGSGTHL